MSLSRANLDRLRSFVEGLEALEIEQFRSSDETCVKCKSPFYGLFDESKAIIPLGKGLWKSLLSRSSSARIFLPSRNSLVNYSSSYMDEPHVAYLIRMDIVRSGHYTRAQLQKGLFNQHELEVNDRSFNAVRPLRCDCDFGDEVFDNGSLPAIFLPNETLVDLEFQNSPVRTGFHLRSKEARRRRSARRKGGETPPRIPHLIVDCYPRVPRGFSVENPYLVPQKGIVISLKFPQVKILRKNARRRTPKPRVVQGLTLPPREKKKYWYFFRKRKRWNFSLHHPLPDDPTWKKPGDLSV